MMQWIRNDGLCCFAFVRECIRGIGEELLSKASHIIDTREEDAVEVFSTNLNRLNKN